MPLPQYDIVAAVTNGWSSEFVVGKDGNLYLRYDSGRSEILLGPAKKARITEIMTNLDRLRSVLP